MTQDQFVIELLNGLNPVFIAVFILGIMTGVFFFSDLMTRLDRLSRLYSRPSRIKFGNLNGRLERKNDFEYLYFYQGRYYTSDQYQFLKRE